MLARNPENLHLVEVIVVSNNIYIFCISQPFLDSFVNNIYDGININGHTLVRSDHPSNTEHGGIAIYYKSHLPVIRRNDISSLNENILLEIHPANKCFLTRVYKPPSQSKDQFNEFCSSFNMLMSNINDKKL